MRYTLVAVLAFIILSCKESEEQIVPTEITSVSPVAGRTGSYITLTGNGFNTNTEILFDTQEAKIISLDLTTIVVAVPAITASTADIHVVNGTENIIAREGFVVKKDTWTAKGELPGEANRMLPVWFSIGTKIFYGLGASNSGSTMYFDFWEYSTTTGEWIQKKDFPGYTFGESNKITIGQHETFIANGKAYIHSNLQMWEYDPTNDEWTRKKDFLPIYPHQNSVFFSINNKGYLSTGYTGVLPTLRKDIWEYNPSTDLWVEKAEFPGVGRQYAVGFAIGNKGYVGGGSTSANSDFYEFDVATNKWTQKTNCPAITDESVKASFSIGNFGYCGDKSTNFYKYDPVGLVWIELDQSPPGTSGKNLWAVNVDGKAYIRTETNLWEMKVD